jgi:hypothetical protein
MRRIYAARIAGTAATAVLAALLTRPVAGAEPAAVLACREQWSTFFGGRQVTLHFTARSEQPVDGRIVWRHAADGRTIARGELAAKLNGGRASEAEIGLRLPEVRDGVVFDTQLSVVLADRQNRVLARHDRPVRLFPTDPFVNRRNWLGGLGIVLYDPRGQTEAVCQAHDLPYRLVGTMSALSGVAQGTVIVGEGLSFEDRRGLAETLLELAAGGASVLCLAPADGGFRFPGGGDEDPQPRRVVLGDCEVIRELDKRLDADAWAPDGRVAATGLEVSTGGGEASLSVAPPPRAWPWLEAVYPQGGRLIVCGFGIVEQWDAGPTPRWLLLRILERLSQNTSRTAASFEKE